MLARPLAAARWRYRQRSMLSQQDLLAFWPPVRLPMPNEEHPALHVSAPMHAHYPSLARLCSNESSSLV